MSFPLNWFVCPFANTTIRIFLLVFQKVCNSVLHLLFDELSISFVFVAKKSMDFDDLLPHVGEFGRYQKLLIFLICLPACIPCGFHAFNQLFMSPVPPHWCRVPELEEAGLTPLQARNISIPRVRSNRFSGFHLWLPRIKTFHIIQLFIM